MKKIILLISFLLAFSCASKQSPDKKEETKPTENTSEQMSNLFNREEKKSSNSDKEKKIQASKTFKTTAFECRLVPWPNAPSPIMRIPKGASLEIRQERKEGAFTWFQVVYLGKEGWVRGTFLK